MAEFREKWLNTMEEWKKRNPNFANTTTTPEQFSSSAQLLISHSVGKSISTIDPNGTLVKSPTAMKQTVVDLVLSPENNSADPLSLVLGSYNKLHSKYQDLISVREQEKRADIEEKRRLLFYRVVTAVLMGAILLSTYAIGDYFDIAMPLRMK